MIIRIIFPPPTPESADLLPKLGSVMKPDSPHLGNERAGKCSVQKCFVKPGQELCWVRDASGPCLENN